VPENVIIDWVNASADFLYFKESMNYHRNLSHLATEGCSKLQKEAQLNICAETPDQFVSKKKERKKYHDFLANSSKF
jgi:hypothetical protein